MDKELKTTFDLYLEEFQTDEQVNARIKKLILENLGLGRELQEIIERFLTIAKQQSYAYSTALGYAMLFWLYYGDDLDTAVRYNEQARELFLQQPDHCEKEGYLTVLSNAVLAYIIKGDFDRAYQEIAAALPLAEQQRQISYYTAFLNNGSFILSELGLYKKAEKQLLETLEKRELIGEPSFCTTIFLLGNLYINQNEPQQAKALIQHYEAFLRKQPCYSFQMYNKILLEAAIAEDDLEKATACYQEIQANFDVDQEDLDAIDVVRALTHYEEYTGQYEKAAKGYERLYAHRKDVLGSTQCLLQKIASFYHHQKEDEKAYPILEEAFLNSRRYDRFVDALYMQDLEDVWEKNRMLSYELLYDRLLKISDAGKRLTKALTWQQLFETIQTEVLELLAASIMEIIVYDASNNTYQIHSKDVTIRRLNALDNTALAACIAEGTILSITNTAANEEWKTTLSSFYDPKILSMYFYPIQQNDTVIAVLYVGSKEAAAFDGAMQDLLRVVCDYLSITITNIDHYEGVLQESSYDYLTKTLNRSGLMRFGNQLLKEAHEQGSSIGALMVDIDDFKKVNDTYGHMIGDEVIKKVTSIMSELQEDGITARFGGEEFTLLIKGKTHEELYHIAETIRHICENQPLSKDELTIHYTISIGCYYCETVQEPLQVIMERADQQLYVAKRNGKNIVQLAEYATLH